MKKFLDEFKEFISKGNVMSMAVGIIIGGAFTAIVNSVVENLLNPLVALFTKGIDLSGIKLNILGAEFGVGAILSAIITFLLTALVVFWLMKGYNKLVDKMTKKKEEEAKEEAPAEPSEEILLLREIRDSLKK